MIVDRTMYISGQIGLDPNNMEMVDGGVRAEADRVLDFCIINILQIIKMVIYKLKALFCIRHMSWGHSGIIICCLAF